MQKQKHTWDTRAWLIGILGGIASGSLASWATYPSVQKQLNSLPPPLFGSHTSDVLSGIIGVLGVLVLPGLVSGVARRLTFLWGLLPLSLALASTDLEDWIENGIKSVAGTGWESLAVFGGCWVISSGPVSLIRWLRIRAAQRHAALLASYQTQREAASGPQEGIWPPPPEYRE